MAIDLQNPTNIGSGWGPPPQFHAPEIGGLVGHILQNRLLQKAQQDKEIADAIKQYQTQREDSAYTEALRNAGLTQGQDISGLGSKQATALAQLIAQNTPDTDRDALIQAQIAHLNRLPSGGGGGGGSATPQTVWDEQGREWRPGPGGRWIPMKSASPPPPSPKLSPTEKGWAAPEIPGVSVDINAPDQPGRALPPDTPAMPETPATPPTTGGADKNLAPGFGKPVSDEDVAALGWARANPNDPRSAAILKKLGIE